MRWVSAGFLRVGGVYGLQRRRKGDKNLMSPPGSPWLTSRFGSSLMDLLATPRSCGFVAARRSSTRRLGRSRIAARQLPGPNTAKLSWRILPRSRAFNTVRPRSPSSSAGTSIRLKPSPKWQRSKQAHLELLAFAAVTSQGPVAAEAPSGHRAQTQRARTPTARQLSLPDHVCCRSSPGAGRPTL